MSREYSTVEFFLRLIIIYVDYRLFMQKQRLYTVPFKVYLLQ